MSIKITETIERQCCDSSKDLNEYKGRQEHKDREYKFCVHCGQIFMWSRRIDSSGDCGDYLKEVVQGKLD